MEFDRMMMMNSAGRGRMEMFFFSLNCSTSY